MATNMGKIVHFRFPDSRTIGGEPKDERPALIVREWTPELVQLQVFLDTDAEGRHNDGSSHGPIEWRTSVGHGPNADQWHFVEECPSA